MEIRVFRCKEFYRITNTVADPDHSNIIKGEGNRLLNVHLAIFFSHKITFSLSVRYCIVMACQLTGPSRTNFELTNQQKPCWSYMRNVVRMR